MLDFLGPFTLIVYFIVGAVIGLFIFPLKHLKYARYAQTICLVFLMFSVGVSLGSGETFWQDLGTAGFKAIFYAILPIAFSIALVYLITRIFFKKYLNKTKEEKPDADCMD